MLLVLQSMPGLAELTSPGFVSRSAAFAAISYYTIAYAAQLLPVEAAAGLVITGLVRELLLQTGGAGVGAQPRHQLCCRGSACVPACVRAFG